MVKPGPRPGGQAPLGSCEGGGEGRGGRGSAWLPQVQCDSAPPAALGRLSKAGLRLRRPLAHAHFTAVTLTRAGASGWGVHSRAAWCATQQDASHSGDGRLPRRGRDRSQDVRGRARTSAWAVLASRDWDLLFRADALRGLTCAHLPGSPPHWASRT